MTYAQAVEDGEVATLAEYAKHAVRGWGTLITMRDAPPNAPIPERLEPATYYRDALAKAEEDLRVAKAMTLHEAAVGAEEEYRVLLAAHEDYQARERTRIERVQTMMAEVEAWEVSEEIASFRDWLLEDLNRSLEHLQIPLGRDDPQRRSAEEYREHRVAKAERDVESCREHWEGEVERTEARNRWLTAFWNDLSKTGVPA